MTDETAALAQAPATPVAVTPAPIRTLTAPEFHTLAKMPAEAEWFANLDNPNTRRAYRQDLQEFMGFVGIRAAGHACSLACLASRPRETRARRLHDPPQARGNLIHV
jgi:hypothetical protein